LILVGDALEKLKTLESESVQTCVTSPPYWGLRDYGIAGQLGQEDDPLEFVLKMKIIFREVRRVLKKDGTLWLNLGDSYSASGRASGTKNLSGKEKSNLGSVHLQSHLERSGASGRAWQAAPGFKKKELIGIPWRVAFALQDDGWYLRQDIIWHKSRVMPESVRDRCTKAHEYFFLLAKSEKYFFNSEAIKEPCKKESKERYKRSFTDIRSGTTKHLRIAGEICPREGPQRAITAPDMRNKRSVWKVSGTNFKGAHFATFPPALIEPCILAGSRPGDTVLDPFSGAGTTWLVSEKHSRKFLGIEINPAYALMAEQRVSGTQKVLIEKP
jgi:DNA modification methylase